MHFAYLLIHIDITWEFACREEEENKKIKSLYYKEINLQESILIPFQPYPSRISVALFDFMKTGWNITEIGNVQLQNNESNKKGNKLINGFMWDVKKSIDEAGGSSTTGSSRVVPK